MNELILMLIGVALGFSLSFLLMYMCFKERIYDKDDIIYNLRKTVRRSQENFMEMRKIADEWRDRCFRKM